MHRELKEGIGKPEQKVATVGAKYSTEIRHRDESIEHFKNDLKQVFV